MNPQQKSMDMGFKEFIALMAVKYCFIRQLRIKFVDEMELATA